MLSTARWHTNAGWARQKRVHAYARFLLYRQTLRWYILPFASVCAFVVLCSYWTLTFFLLFALASATPLAILYFWFWTLPPVIVSVAATISFAKRVGSQWALSSVGVGLVCGVFVAVPVERIGSSFEERGFGVRRHESSGRVDDCGESGWNDGFARS